MDFMIWVFLMSYWLIIPAVFICVILILLFKAKTKAGRWSVGLVGAIGLAVTAWYILGGERMLLDAKVRELCEKDGGVKIYEREVLTPDLYDQYARKNWVLPTRANAAATDEYLVERHQYSYKQGDPRLLRVQSRIIRRRDGKVLGEYVRYGRGGGDLPGLWHGSSFSCPNPANTTFATDVFLKGDEQ